eukprot:COSAG01_NODE_746_length_13865_cov_11.259625_2_plen_71_part_00
MSISASDARVLTNCAAEALVLSILRPAADVSQRRVLWAAAPALPPPGRLPRPTGRAVSPHARRIAGITGL